jgi:hypothetical protein
LAGTDEPTEGAPVARVRRRDGSAADGARWLSRRHRSRRHLRSGATDAGDGGSARRRTPCWCSRGDDRLDTPRSRSSHRRRG